MVPEDVLIPEFCDNVTLHGERDFADVIKRGILKWRQLSQIIHDGLHAITRVLMREKKMIAHGSRERLENALLLALKLGAGITAKEGRCLSVLKNAREQTHPISL